MSQSKAHSRGPLPAGRTLPETQPSGQPPPAPEDLSPAIRELWDALWTSSLGNVWDPVVDRTVVERYAWTLHHWRGAQEQLNQLGNSPTTLGSQGQLVLHPITQYVRQLEDQLRSQEKELGLTPMSRARLGLTIAEGQKSAAQLNDMVKKKRSSS